MNTNDTARLAAAVNILRPDWPTESLRTFLNTNLAARPFHDAARAMVWVATDGETKTPARVLKAGPWWKFGNADPEPERASRCDRCQSFHKASEGHDPNAWMRRRPSEETLASWAAQAKAEIAKKPKCRDRAAEAARVVEDTPTEGERL